MKITIVTVCYNTADTIGRTIESVLEQTYPDIEYIIVDGKSKDNTMEVIGKYADRISRIVSEPDNGIYDAMNKGIALATGDYINFMNAGDIFSSPDVIAEVVRQMEPTADVVYGDSTAVLPGGKRQQSGVDDFSLISKRPIYRHNASFTRASLHKRFPFDLTKKSEYLYALDYNNIFTLYSNGAKFQKVDVDVVTWMKEGTSDRPMKNVSLTFRISHQFRRPTVKERLICCYDMAKALRREIIKRLR